MGQVKRPVKAHRLAILNALRAYPDAKPRQVAALLGVTPHEVSMVRNDYGLYRKPHPEKIGNEAR